MSADYRHVIERFYKMYARKDIAATLALFDPQVEMHPAENFIYATGKPFVGPDAIQGSIFTRVDDDWDGFTATTQEILGAGEVVIARGRYRGTFKATGTPIDAEFVHVFRFKNGRISMWQSYTDTAQFKEAVSGQSAGAAQ
ncbi:MAG: nuclear transport factor 2 family protein [Acidobacteriia bacterium]|nr:nuclear transport factor 2 family protein [Terriglobia bacterium]